MEDATVVLDKIVGWAQEDRRVSAVVLTGSRGRQQRVDDLSDLDVEVIGPSPSALADDDSWTSTAGHPMVILPFDLPALTTRLVVLPGGRKIDFSIWPESRLTEMGESGLNDLYERGYTVLLDKAGLTRGLPEAGLTTPVPEPPDQDTFTRLESEFWFEATQVAVYLLRQDLWVVKMRERTMHNCLLAMLEWRAQSDPNGARFTWHIGHHLDEWLSPEDYATAGQVFTQFDPVDTLRGVTAAMRLFTRATAETAAHLAFKYRPELADAASTHVHRLLRPIWSGDGRPPQRTQEDD